MHLLISGKISVISGKIKEQCGDRPVRCVVSGGGWPAARGAAEETARDRWRPSLSADYKCPANDTCTAAARGIYSCRDSSN
jgi:hypothetical protein